MEAFLPFLPQKTSQTRSNEFRYHLSSAYFLLNREAFKILDSIAQESRDLASTMQLRLSVLEELECLKESNTKERSEINDKRKSLDVTIESFRKSLSQTSRINFAFEKYLDFRSLYGN